MRVTETESLKGSERVTETEALYLLTVDNGKILGTEESTCRFHEGERIVIEPEKRDRYTFTGWTVSDDNVIRQNDGEKLIIAMPEEDLSVTAEYEETKYSLTVENRSGSGTYSYGDTVSIKAEAVSGKEFSNWEIERGSADIDDVAER